MWFLHLIVLFAFVPVAGDLAQHRHNPPVNLVDMLNAVVVGWLLLGQLELRTQVPGSLLKLGLLLVAVLRDDAVFLGRVRLLVLGLAVVLLIGLRVAELLPDLLHALLGVGAHQSTVFPLPHTHGLSD